MHLTVSTTNWLSPAISHLAGTMHTGLPVTFRFPDNMVQVGELADWMPKAELGRKTPMTIGQM